MNESTAMEIQDAEAKLENPAWKDSVEASTIFEPFSKNKHLYQINLGGDPNRKQTKFVQLRGKFVAGMLSRLHGLIMGRPCETRRGDDRRGKENLRQLP